MNKNEYKEARENFIEWYFGNNDFSPDHNKVNIIPPDELPLSYRDIITRMVEELIESGRSVWTFEDLVKDANGAPDHILQELKHAEDWNREGLVVDKFGNRIDDEMRADLEAQDYDTFGETKI